MARAPLRIAVVVEPLHGFGIGAHGVFGDVHGRQAVGHGKLDGFFRGALEVVDAPVFDQAANGAGTEKRGGFNGNSDALGNFDDGTDVRFDGARRAVRFDAHVVVGNFARQRFDVVGRARTGTRQADIHGIDGQHFHQVKNFDFVCDGRDREWRDSASRRAGFRH